MIDKSDYTIAGAAMTLGLGAQQAMVIWSHLPWSARALLQGLLTIGLGIGALTAQHFWRRFLRRRWPDEEKK